MIEKLLGLVLVMVYVVWSFTAQSATPLDELTQQEVTVMEEDHSVGIHLSQERFHNIILDAGEKNGWIMTEFKSNALIAEKVENDNALSVTITFNKTSFSVLPQNSELEGAIAAMLH